jgi:hypothetical protein
MKRKCFSNTCPPLIISHLSWFFILEFPYSRFICSQWRCCFFGTPKETNSIEPVFLQVSSTSRTLYRFVLHHLLKFCFGPGWVWRLVLEFTSCCTLHIYCILVKNLVLRGSKLMPDKKNFGYSFPCDGPGRGGTCDISAWMPSTYLCSGC